MVKFAEAEKRGRGGEGGDRRIGPMMMLEPPKISRAVWESLKAHIMRERRRKKEEQEADAEEERIRKERENRKKQHAMTLEETREQISQKERELNDLKQQKHELVQQLKKVLHEESRRKEQQQQQQQQQQQNFMKEEMMSVHPYGHGPLPLGGHPQMLFQPSMVSRAGGGIPALYKVGTPAAQPPQTLLPPIQCCPPNPMIQNVLTTITETAPDRQLGNCGRNKWGGKAYLSLSGKRTTQCLASLKRPRSPTPPLSQSQSYPSIPYQFKNIPVSQTSIVSVSHAVSAKKPSSGTSVYVSNQPGSYYHTSQPSAPPHANPPTYTPSQTSQQTVVAAYLPTQSGPATISPSTQGPLSQSGRDDKHLQNVYMLSGRVPSGHMGPLHPQLDPKSKGFQPGDASSEKMYTSGAGVRPHLILQTGVLPVQQQQPPPPGPYNNHSVNYSRSFF